MTKDIRKAGIIATRCNNLNCEIGACRALYRMWVYTASHYDIIQGRIKCSELDILDSMALLVGK